MGAVAVSSIAARASAPAEEALESRRIHEALEEVSETEVVCGPPDELGDEEGIVWSRKCLHGGPPGNSFSKTSRHERRSS